MKTKHKCVLCGKTFSEPPCSPFPLADSGVCCWRCDDTKVTPARLVRKGMPEAEAKVCGVNLHRAVKFHRKRMARK